MPVVTITAAPHARVDRLLVSVVDAVAESRSPSPALVWVGMLLAVRVLLAPAVPLLGSLAATQVERDLQRRVVDAMVAIGPTDADGPSQAGLATRAETRVPGQTAEEYIRNSIVNPNDYIVEGFAEGVMYQNYGTDLTPEQIDDLVRSAIGAKSR